MEIPISLGALGLISILIGIVIVWSPALLFLAGIKYFSRAKDFQVAQSSVAKYFAKGIALKVALMGATTMTLLSIDGNLGWNLVLAYPVVVGILSIPVLWLIESLIWVSNKNIVTVIIYWAIQLYFAWIGSCFIFTAAHQ